MPPIKIVETKRAVSIHKLDVDSKARFIQCSATSGHIGGEMPEDQFGAGEFTMSCANGGKITKIDFANFGTAHLIGDCRSAQLGACAGANTSKAVVESLCLGKTSCSISPRVGQFGKVDPCPDVAKTLVVIASGCTPQPVPPPPKLPLNETSYVFTFGQNVAGFTSLHVKGPAGTKIYARHAETLKDIPSVDEPAVAVNNQYCNNQYQPGSAKDHGCTNCNAFGGLGMNGSCKFTSNR